MGIRYQKNSAALLGHVGAEEAEGLSAWLLAHPRAALRLDQCSGLHAAVLQVLLARRPVIKALPADARLAALLGGAACPEFHAAAAAARS